MTLTPRALDFAILWTGIAIGVAAFLINIGAI